MIDENELRNLALKWKQQAMSQVPAAYAERGLHSKYLKLDNEAAGLDSCAYELLDLLDSPRSRTPHETDPEQGGAKVFSRPECLFMYCPYGERGLCTDEAGGCLHKNGNYKPVATDDDK